MTAEKVRKRCAAIPKAIEARDRAMAEMRAEGAALREIAKAASMSHVAVAKILSKREDRNA
jgi:hypothetical protein